MMGRSLLALKVAAPALLVLAVWQVIVQARPRSEFFFGSPLGIARESWVLTTEGGFARDLGITALEAILGFLSGTVFGTAVGLLLWMSKTAYAIAKPYLIALGSVPTFALGPVLIFWFGTGIWSKVALAFLATFVVAVVQAYTGATEADPNLLRLVRAFGGTRWQVFTKIIVPSAMIWVLAGIRLNIGMALLGAFIGEFLSSRFGLGYLIIVAQGLYNVNQVWVGILGIIFIAIVFHLATLPIERWANRWK